MEEKFCSTCGRVKSLSEFYKRSDSRDGYRSACKKCCNFNPKRDISQIVEKACNRCKEVKLLEEFISEKRNPTGYGTYCLDCAQIKLCRGCNKKKNLNEFNTSSKSVDGRRYKCKQCENTMVRERYHNNESVRMGRLRKNAVYRYKKDTKLGSKERLLRKKYNISLDEYEEMKRIQNDRCKICNRAEDEIPRGILAVDHDHTTGEIRGLLCDLCNRGIGMLKEDIQILQNAIIYLLNPAMHAYYG